MSNPQPTRFHFDIKVKSNQYQNEDTQFKIITKNGIEKEIGLLNLLAFSPRIRSLFLCNPFVTQLKIDFLDKEFEFIEPYFLSAVSFEELVNESNYEIIKKMGEYFLNQEMIEVASKIRFDEKSHNQFLDEFNGETNLEYMESYVQYIVSNKDLKIFQNIDKNLNDSDIERKHEFFINLYERTFQTPNYYEKENFKFINKLINISHLNENSLRLLSYLDLEDTNEKSLLNDLSEFVLKNRLNFTPRGPTLYFMLECVKKIKEKQIELLREQSIEEELKTEQTFSENTQNHSNNEKPQKLKKKVNKKGKKSSGSSTIQDTKNKEIPSGQKVDTKNEEKTKINTIQIKNDYI